MKAQFEVDAVLWGKVRVASLLKSKAIGELLTPILEREFGGEGGFEGLSKKERKQPSKASVVVGCGLVGVEPPKPIPAVSEPPKDTPEEVEKKQRSCKHYFLGGKGGCVKCGWVPPVAY